MSSNKKLLLFFAFFSLIFLFAVLFFNTISPYSSSLKQAKQLDLKEEKIVIEKKRKFFTFMKGIIETENNKIITQRNLVLTDQKRNLKSKKVRQIAKEYKVALDSQDFFNTLLTKVDTIPIELVLVQSANESMWGQSRFAQEGNNMFGEWCFKKGCGMVPARRNQGAAHEVASFKNINESVKSYLRNINTGRAYQKVRNIRFSLRERKLEVTGIKLAEGLLKYSERGTEYVHELQAMITINKQLIDSIEVK